MDYFKYIPVAFHIVEAVVDAVGDFVANEPVVIAPIRAYIGGEHVEIDVVIKRLPPP